jgi:ribosomal protein L30
MSRMLLTIEQTGSPIRKNDRCGVVRTLRGLRLNKIGRTAQMPDTPEVQGMIARVDHLVKIIYWEIDIRYFADEVRCEYKELITGPQSRIVRGEVLWDRFEAAVARCLADSRKNDRELTECVNEIAVAAVIATDKALDGRRIEYEPAFLPDGRKIDFVVDRDAENLYVEVKTVRPKTVDDDDAAWAKFLRRKKLHPETVEYMVTSEGMGGAIYGNEFASRGHFLDYTRAFEERLAAAKAIRPGVGVIVFCGNGFAWRLSQLENFADFYRTGTHRADDPFGPMEAEAIKEKGIELKKNIDHFAFLQRPIDHARRQKFYYPVRGPQFGVRTA